MNTKLLIGGIYNRPIAIGDFMHFTVGSFALLKVISKIKAHKEIIILITIIYAIFAISFAYVFRTNPKKASS